MEHIYEILVRCHPNCWGMREGEGVVRTGEGRKVLVSLLLIKYVDRCRVRKLAYRTN